MKLISLSRIFLSILCVSRSLTSTPYVLGSLDTRPCDLLALTPGLAFFSNNLHAGVGVFIFVRHGLSFFELFTSLFFHLAPTLTTLWSTFLQKFWFLLLNVYAPIFLSSQDTIYSGSFPRISFSMTNTLFHRFFGIRSSTNTSFAPSSLTFSCSLEVLQKMSSIRLFSHCLFAFYFNSY